jgi:hypothetical protein
MYNWVVLLHVASVLAFMLAHGVHVSAMWAMGGEADPERMLTFFNIVPSITTLRILLAALLLSGAVAGFMGSWWGRGWIWTSLALLAFIAVTMWRFGGEFYLSGGAGITSQSADRPRHRGIGIGRPRAGGQSGGGGRR